MVYQDLTRVSFKPYSIVITFKKGKNKNNSNVYYEALCSASKFIKIFYLKSVVIFFAEMARK